MKTFLIFTIAWSAGSPFSLVQAVVIPTQYHTERPVMVAKLVPLQEETANMAFSMTLNRPATLPTATSFTFTEGRTDVRCGGRCLPVGQKYRVVALEKDSCGSITYSAIRQENAQLTDDLPDTQGHLAPELVVVDHTKNLCQGERRDWEVEHSALGEIRYFEGVPEALLTIQ